MSSRKKKDTDSEEEGSSTDENNSEEEIDIGDVKIKKKSKSRKKKRQEEVVDIKEEEEEVEGEGEDMEARNELIEKMKIDEFPKKLKKLVFKCCGKFIKDDKRREVFLKDMEGEINKNEVEYTKSSDACIKGLKKLVMAGQEGIKAMAFAIDTVRDVIERVRRLRNYKKKVNVLEERVVELKKRFLDIELEYYEDDFEESLVRLFDDMKVLKDDFDGLLGKIKNFKLSVRIRWKLAMAFLAGAIGSGIVLFVGGAFTTILGAGCFLTTLLTEGLALPIALTLYGLSLLGVFSGVSVCIITCLSTVIVGGSALVQHLSCKASLKKSKKLIKKIQSHKGEEWWGTMEEMMDQIKDAEKTKAGVMKDVEDFVRVYQRKHMRPDEIEELEEEEEEDEEQEESECEEEGEDSDEEEGEDTDEEKDDEPGTMGFNPFE